MKLRHHSDDQGAAVVEMALVIGLLLMLAMGAFEYGMAFRSWQGVTSASREGARVGASAGSVASADCAILEASAAALLANSGDEVIRLEIFEADPVSGIPQATTAYRPFDPETDDPSNLVCGSWFRISNGWPPGSREDTGTNRDWLGVAVTYQHNWISGFLWWSGSVQWTDDSIMRLEPVQYS